MSTAIPETLEKLFCGIDEDTSREVFSRLVRDKTTATYNTIDQSCADNIKSKLHKPTTGHIERIRTKLEPKHQKLFEDTYPEFKFNFIGDISVGHPFLNVSRSLETTLLLRNFIKLDNAPSILKRYAYYDDYVTDVGGNAVNNIAKNLIGIHSCEPILSNYDAYRKSNRLEKFIHMEINTENKLKMIKSMLTDDTVMCRNKVQNCNRKSLYMLAIHSIYDIPIRDLADAMDKKSALVLYGTFMFNSMMLLNNEGYLETIDMRYNICGNQITFVHVNDTSFGYSHDFVNYLKYITSPVVYSRNGVCYVKELLFNRNDIQFFKMMKVEYSPKNDIFYGITFPEWRDKTRIVYYDWYYASADETRVKIILRPKSLIVDTNLYNDICNYALGLSDTKFQPSVIFDYAKSTTSRVVHDAKNIKEFKFKDPDYLYSLSFSIYMYAYQRKWEHGKIIQNLISEQKELREGVHIGWIKKIFWRVNRLFGLNKCWVKCNDWWRNRKFKVPYEEIITMFNSSKMMVTKSDVEFVKTYNEVIGNGVVNFFKKNKSIINMKYFSPEYNDFCVADKMDREIMNVCDLVLNVNDGTLHKALSNEYNYDTQPINRFVGAGVSSGFKVGSLVPCTLHDHTVVPNPADGYCLYYSLLATDDTLLIDEMIAKLIAADMSYLIPKEKQNLENILANKAPGDTTVIEHFCHVYNAYVVVHFKDKCNCNPIAFGNKQSADDVIHLLFTFNEGDKFGIGHYERIPIETVLCNYSPELPSLINRMVVAHESIKKPKRNFVYPNTLSKLLSLGMSYFREQMGIFELLEEHSLFSKYLDSFKYALKKPILGKNEDPCSRSVFVGIPNTNLIDLLMNFIVVVSKEELSSHLDETYDTKHSVTVYEIDDMVHLFFKYTNIPSKLIINEVYYSLESLCKTFKTGLIATRDFAVKYLSNNTKVVLPIKQAFLIEGVTIDVIQTIHRLKHMTKSSDHVYFFDPLRKTPENYKWSMGKFRLNNVKNIYDFIEIADKSVEVIILMESSMRSRSKVYLLELITSSGLKNVSIFLPDKRSRTGFYEYLQQLNVNDDFESVFDLNFGKVLNSITDVDKSLSDLTSDEFIQVKSKLLPEVKNRGYSKLEEILASFSISCSRFLELGASPGGMTNCLIDKFKAASGVSHVYHGTNAIPHKSHYTNVTIINSDRHFGYNGDLTEFDQVQYLIGKLNGFFDLIVADCCSLNGVDDPSNFEILYHQIFIMKEKLKYGGSFILKVIMDEQSCPILRDAARYFHACSFFKPKTANPLNKEIFMVFMNKRIACTRPMNFVNTDKTISQFEEILKKLNNIKEELRFEGVVPVDPVEEIEETCLDNDFLSVGSARSSVSFKSDLNYFVRNSGNEIDTVRINIPSSEETCHSNLIELEIGQVKDQHFDLKLNKDSCGVKQNKTMIGNKINVNDLIKKNFSIPDLNTIIVICQNIKRDILNKDKVDFFIIDLVEKLDGLLPESYMDEHLVYEKIEYFVDSILNNKNFEIVYIEDNTNPNLIKEQWSDQLLETFTLKSLRSVDLPEGSGTVLQNWNRSSALSKYNPHFEKCPDNIENRLDIIIRNSIREVREIWRITPDIFRDHYYNLYRNYRLFDDNDVSYVTKRKVLLEKKNVGIIDIKHGVFIVQPTQSKVLHEYVFNGNEFVKLRKDLKAQMYKSRYGLVSDDMEIMNDQALYDSTKHLNHFLYSHPDIENIQGVPGCGKTTFILNNSTSSDLLLAATRDGAIGLRSKSQGKHQHIYTIHSFLINCPDMIFEHVWIDEALKEHFGTINMIILKTRCKYLHIIGDNKQIPYFNKISSVVVLFSDITRHIACTSYLTKSYRVPVDVAYSLGKYYEKGFVTCNEVYESMKLEIIKSQLGIPKNIDLKTTKFLVFKKSEKQTLMSQGFEDVSTVGEYQGRQIEHVRLIRLSNAERDEIYTRHDQIIVALSRHTKSLTYYTLRGDDAISKIIRSVPDRSTLRSTSFVSVAYKGAGIYYDVPEFHQMLTKKVVFEQDNIVSSIVDLNYGDKFAPIRLKTTTINHKYYTKPVMNYRSADVTFLQTFYDYVLPGNSCIDYKYDQYHAEKRPFEFSHSNVTVALSDFSVVNENFDKLKPNLRTSIAYPRKLNQLDALVGLNKRNLNIPELDEVVEEGYIIDLSVDLFVKTYIKDLSVLEKFSCPVNQIYPSESLIEEWFHDQPDSIRQQIKDVITLEAMKLSSYSLMNKKNIKPGLTTETPYEYAAVQTIASQNKTNNMIFCPIFRELKRRFISLLKPNFFMFTDISPDEFANLLTSRFPINLLSAYEKLEIDIGKYDKSQYRLLFEIECRIYKLLGLPDIFIKYWRKAHEYTTLKDRLHSVTCDVLYQRKSGDASTFFGNTVVLMVVLCVLFDLTDAYGIFSGDDSVLWLREVIDRNDLCANIFNLESKFYRYQYSYFCSKYLLVVNDEFRFVPDPLKVLTKLGRHDIVNWEHLEEYRISLNDLLKDYNDASIYQELALAMSERHCKPIEAGLLLSTLYEIVRNNENFKSLYYVNEDDILLSDPSRPNLDI